MLALSDAGYSMSAALPPGTTEQIVWTAFDRCPTGILVVDAAGKIGYLNHEIERLFGYGRDELLGALVELLLPADLAAGHAKHRSFYHAMPTTRPMGAGRDLFGRHKDGRHIPVEIGLSPMPTADGLFVVATVVDISQRRHLEARLQRPHKLEALGSLASGIAHDLNNVLHGISRHAELARAATAGSPAAASNLEVVLDNVRQGLDLINRVLLFTRHDEPERVDTDFAGAVAEGVRLLRAGLPANIDLREDLASATPHVRAGVNEVHQIVMNLGNNAIHAMRERGGVLAIAARAVAVDRVFIADHPGMRQGVHVHLRVSDTGAGIHPDVIGSIYEPFFTTKPHGEGTGLGLAVVDRIVQALGGTIEVRSRPGQGTQFDVYIPSVAVDATSAPTRRVPGLDRRSVLLVSGEGGRARLGQRVLEEAGYDVTVHSTGLHAMESFRANPKHFDMVIADRAMSPMGGLELVARARGLRPTIPALVVLEPGDSEPVETRGHDGRTLSLVKPYEPGTLVEKANRLLGPRA
jgi:two-component system cell cycle sensor histidine kinase/response regulator CckA